MNIFNNTIWFKRTVVVVSFLIVSLILWNTYAFFQKFKQDEKAKMELFATTLKELTNNPNLDEEINVITKIYDNIQNIPVILTDANGNIITSRNLDSVKSRDKNYLARQLAMMKRENHPIEVSYKDLPKQYIYYKNSSLLYKLTYYPIALLLILGLFLTVIYLFLNSTKIAEQNKLWTGMAKETAHQIGTPLSSLLGWVAILKTQNVNNEYVTEIEKDIYRLNTIANRFSKIGSLPELKPQNIVATTKTAFDYLASRSSKQISFSFTASQDAIIANLNSELYGWVIENLLKNAIDAMQGKGSVALTISETTKKVKITITDTGKGILKSQQKQIFKPGFTTKKRGWGLGLSLSKRIIEDYHNGKIYVAKSEINKGTTFEILLDRV